jgi:hypothetical protein
MLTLSLAHGDIALPTSFGHGKEELPLFAASAFVALATALRLHLAFVQVEHLFLLSAPKKQKTPKLVRASGPVRRRGLSLRGVYALYLQ